MKKWFQCIFIVSLLQLTACWDSSNIESLSFVMGVGIEVQEDQEDTIGLLTQLYLPLSDENISSSISYRNKYSTGNSVLDAIRHLELIDQGIMSDHQMILVLDTDAVKKWGVEKLINQKIRDERTKRGVKVVLTNESLGTLFSYPKGNNASPTSKTIDDLSENKDRTTEIPAPVTLGLLADSASRHQSIVLPNVRVKDDNIKFDGGYIVKNGEEMGTYVSPYQVSLLNWLTGDIKGGVLTKVVNGNRTVYEILDVHLDSIETSLTNDRLRIDIKVSSDGRLAENWDPHEDAYDAQYLKNLEKELQAQLTSDVETMIHELQHEFKTDPVNLQQYVKIQHYDFWEKKQSNWDAVFEQADIHYEVDLSIIDFGTRGNRSEIHE
ncbi:Ger(x)C family spore germination protein [Shouchella miscanthi]|uniref:Ger(x)C family spore germination protein n=1 Tax=Shouchella miscanthi TaxID=2598861 RepID=UPI0011A23858|nr:Ger(x)C family spore germination protein [Shouchella miscanthi]